MLWNVVCSNVADVELRVAFSVQVSTVDRIDVVSSELTNVRLDALE